MFWKRTVRDIAYVHLNIVKFNNPSKFEKRLGGLPSP